LTSTWSYYSAPLDSSSSATMASVSASWSVMVSSDMGGSVAAFEGFPLDLSGTVLTQTRSFRCSDTEPDSGPHGGSREGSMKGLKTTLITAIAVGLLAGSAVGVAAQDEAEDPVEFTAKWAFGPEVRTEALEFDGGTFTTRGGAWRPGVFTEASDPRLQGTLSIAANSNQYADGPEVWNYAFRIENEDGAWQQMPTINLAGGDDDLNTTTGVLVGEGGYAGLIAVFDNLSENSSWDLHGYIIDGELTPAPEPFTTE
jgi:hypothetical protein